MLEGPDADQVFEEWAREDDGAANAMLRRALAPAMTTPNRPTNAAPRSPQVGAPGLTPGAVPLGTPIAVNDPYYTTMSPAMTPAALQQQLQQEMMHGQIPVMPPGLTPIYEAPAPHAHATAPAPPLAPEAGVPISAGEHAEEGYGKSPTLQDRVQRRRALEPFGGSRGPASGTEADPTGQGPRLAAGIRIVCRRIRSQLEFDPPWKATTPPFREGPSFGRLGYSVWRCGLGGTWRCGGYARLDLSEASEVREVVVQPFLSGFEPDRHRKPIRLCLSCSPWNCLILPPGFGALLSGFPQPPGFHSSACNLPSCCPAGFGSSKCFTPHHAYSSGHGCSFGRKTWTGRVRDRSVALGYPPVQSSRLCKKSFARGFLVFLRGCDPGFLIGAECVRDRSVALGYPPAHFLESCRTGSIPDPHPYAEVLGKAFDPWSILAERARDRSVALGCPPVRLSRAISETQTYNVFLWVWLMDFGACLAAFFVTLQLLLLLALWRLLVRTMPGRASPLSRALYLPAASATDGLVLPFRGLVVFKDKQYGHPLPSGRAPEPRKRVRGARMHFAHFAHFAIWLGWGTLPAQVWAAPEGLQEAISQATEFAEAMHVLVQGIVGLRRLPT